MTISKSLVMISKSLVMISKSLVNYSNSRNNIFQYIKLLVITSINVIFIIILIKIILYNYFKKSKKQIELNSAGIDSRIVSNDNINLKFEETANVSKQHMLDNNIDIYNHIANIERQFHNETAKISDCVAKIEVINHNILKTNTLTKINVLVEKINKYFEFFRELDLKKGETYKKKIYFEFNRWHGIPSTQDIRIHNGFNGFYSIDPYEITPLLMKYFEKYYDNAIDKFYPLDFQVFAGDAAGTSLDWYESAQYKLVNLHTECCKILSLKGIYTFEENFGMTHTRLMNRNSVRLLDETEQEFEHKILQHILYELQDKYVFYKQIEFYTKPL